MAAFQLVVSGFGMWSWQCAHFNTGHPEYFRRGTFSDIPNSLAAVDQKDTPQDQQIAMQYPLPKRDLKITYINQPAKNTKTQVRDLVLEVSPVWGAYQLDIKTKSS